MQLRWYQEAAVEAAWNTIRYGKCNPCIVVPTGGGKSWIIAELVRQVVQVWDGRALVLQHRKELIQQNAEKIKVLLPGVPVGIYSAGLRAKETEPDVVVAGIQSAYKQACSFDRRHVVIVDEAHLIPRNDTTMYRSFLDDLGRVNPGLRIIGLTATPYRTSEGLVTDGGVLDQICYEVPVRQLIAEGFLCELTSKPSEMKISMEAVHIRKGEYVQKEMEDTFLAGRRVQDACKEIVARCHDRRSVLIFTSGIAHAERVRETLETLTADRVEQVTGQTLPLERAATLDAFKEGRIRFLVNVDVLCLDESTEILSREGWVGIDEITPEHRVACWSDGSIHFAKPKTIVKRPRGPDEKMVSVKSNGLDIRVTRNHRMIVACNRSGCEWKKVSAESIVGKRVILPANGLSDPDQCVPSQPMSNAKRDMARVRSLSYCYRKKYGLDADSALKEARKEVARKNAMQFKQPADLTIDECKLIGFWIGDGTLSCGRCSISQSNAYPKNIKYVDDLLKATGICHSRKSYKPSKACVNGSVRWTLARGTGSRSQSASVGYFKIEPYLEKNGSDLLWGLDIDQFAAFLDGWHRADGLHHSKSTRSKRVACTNKKLLDLVQAIASCRGIRTSLGVCSSPTKKNHRQQWSLSWYSGQKIHITKTRFRQETGVKSERVWCVTSETGNIVIRRNGKVSVVGNTTGFDAPNIDAIAAFDCQRAAIGHCIARVDTKIEDRRFELKRVNERRPQPFNARTGDGDPFTNGASQKAVHASKKRGDVRWFGIQRLTT